MRSVVSVGCINNKHMNVLKVKHVNALIRQLQHCYAIGLARPHESQLIEPKLRDHNRVCSTNSCLWKLSA